MPKLNGGHLFIRCLKMEGIEKVFTIVGDTILPLVDAGGGRGKSSSLTRAHEGAALHMADGYARITGRPACGIFTGGPGFSNAHLGPARNLHFGKPGGVRGGLRRAAGKGHGDLPGN